MRTNLLVAVALILGVALILSSCQKYGMMSGPTEAGPGSLLTKKDGDVFFVSPSGGDDTDNIQKAFDDAIAAGPGAVVELGPGQFYCHNIVVKGFEGTFRGAGMDVTRIDVIRGLDPGGPPITKSGSLQYGEWTAFFQFEDADITIMDLGFEITPFVPAEPCFWSGFTSDDLAFIVLLMGHTQYSRFERVEFKGNAGPLMGYNTRVGAMITGGHYNEWDKMTWYSEPNTGRHTFSNCVFDYVLQGMMVWGLTDGELLVGGNAGSRNQFKSSVWPFVIIDHVNSIADISYNDITNVMGIGVYCRQWEKPRARGEPFDWNPGTSDWYIAHNSIQCSGGPVDGVILEDWVSFFIGRKALAATVTGNKISMNSDLGGIHGYAVQGAVISNNVIEGSMAAGIYLGAMGDAVDDCKILGNNVRHVNGIPIWLGPTTSNCTVVGGPNKTAVLDEGTDNTLVGVNNYKGNPPGPEVREAMKEMQRIRRGRP